MIKLKYHALRIIARLVAIPYYKIGHPIRTELDNMEQKYGTEYLGVWD
jgi:hypothetical protein